ncbi:MAG TPA: hypothetical protein VGV14_03175 [Rhodanobacter sp.]|nr:hypothetical protein [Rhodanobacter sp.]
MNENSSAHVVVRQQLKAMDIIYYAHRLYLLHEVAWRLSVTGREDTVALVNRDIMWLRSTLLVESWIVGVVSMRSGDDMPAMTIQGPDREVIRPTHTLGAIEIAIHSYIKAYQQSRAPD